MKKWIFFVLAAFFLFIGLLVYRSASMDMEDYLKSAEKFQQEGTEDMVLFNLQKALEKCVERYGENSGEAAEIYRKLGKAESYDEQSAEYFDKACAIYEEIGMPGKAADLWYENGVKLAKNRQREAAKDALLKAAAAYEEYGYEDADRLCVGYCYLAVLQDEAAEGLRYYHLAEEAMDGLTEENRTQVAGKIYSGTAEIFFGDEKYEEALAYYKKHFETQESAGVEAAELADDYNFAAACLAYLGELKEAGEYLDKAVAAYESAENIDYQGLSIAMVHRALIDGFSENPDGEQVMEYGSTALAYYTGRGMITQSDMNCMGYCRAVMLTVFKTVYPDKKEYQFDEWYKANTRLRATTYQFQ